MDAHDQSRLDRDDQLDIVNRDPSGELALVGCPECGSIASIEWSSWVGDTLHVKVRCIGRHWFLMLADRVTYYGTDVTLQYPRND